MQNFYTLILSLFKGTRVWVPDPTNVWIGGVLLEDLKDDQLELELENGNVSFFLCVYHHVHMFCLYRIISLVSEMSYRLFMYYRLLVNNLLSVISKKMFLVHLLYPVVHSVKHIQLSTAESL